MKITTSRTSACLLCAALFIVVAVSKHGIGIDDNSENNVVRIIPEIRRELADLKAVDRRRIKDALQVSALVAIINEESKQDGNHALKHFALRELGRFPDSDEAIRVLLREIAFEAPKVSSRDPLATYSAAGVLSTMGARARTRLLTMEFNKALADPELYLRCVVLVKMDQDDSEWNQAKEISLKRLKHMLEIVERERVPDDMVDQKAAILFNLKRMTTLIETPTFSARRIPDPNEANK